MNEQMNINLEAAYSLKGKTALVTGGGTGIGKAIAQIFLECGAKVVIAGRRADVLEQAAAELGPNCSAETLDLTDIKSLAAFEKRISENHGNIDILVNNAGNTIKKPFHESNMEEFDAVMDVHVRGAAELSRLFIQTWLKNEMPRSIIFTSSMTAYIGQPMVLGYTTAKSAINGIVRGISAEYAANNIRVNGVAPGWIDTDVFRKATDGDAPRKAKIMSRIPMQTLGETTDIGWACAFLSSNAAKYITGQVLLVDGGGATGF